MVPEPTPGNLSWFRNPLQAFSLASCKSPCAQMVVTASRKEVCAYGVPKLPHRVHYACVQYILLAPVAHGKLPVVHESGSGRISGNLPWLRTHFWQPLMASCKSPCAQMVVTASRKEVCAYGVPKLLHRVHYACVQYILLAPVAHGELQEGIAERNCQKELPEGIAGRNCRKELQEGIAGRNCRKELPEGIARRNCRKEMPEGIAGRNCRK